jgi:hypothetical protein
MSVGVDIETEKELFRQEKKGFEKFKKKYGRPDVETILQKIWPYKGK